jgi:hypothetical protein
MYIHNEPYKDTSKTQQYQMQDIAQQHRTETQDNSEDNETFIK